MDNKNIKCIICGKVTKGSDEHIIPKALGNNLLRIDKVCKQCNENLGKYVDEHLTTNFLSQGLRMQRGLKGQSKKVPNPFSKAKDADGNEVYLDSNFKPYKPTRLKIDGNKISGSGSNKYEILSALKKKLKRIGKSDNEIADLLDTLEINYTKYKPKLTYSIYVDFNKIDIAFLKIAYEYMYLFYEDVFKEDEKAEFIRNILYKASLGDTSVVYNEIYNPEPDEDNIIKKKTNQFYKDSHSIFLIKNTNNKLYLMISLFNIPFFIKSICVSDNADKYDKYIEKGIIIEVGSNNAIILI